MLLSDCSQVALRLLFDCSGCARRLLLRSYSEIARRLLLRCAPIAFMLKDDEMLLSGFREVEPRLFRDCCEGVLRSFYSGTEVAPRLLLV